MVGKIGPFDLIVHIGAGKTGSSSIQKTLSANHAPLKSKGFAYIGLMGEEAPHKSYPWQKAGGWPDLLANGRLQAQQQLQKMLTQTILSLSESGYAGAIWSNESIFGNDDLVIPVLKELEKLGVRVKIIVYIRRHDAWIRSAYLQWGIKHKTYNGPVKPFAEWRKTQRLNFSGGLKPWLDMKWEDVAVRNFDTCGDVVLDFLRYYSLQGSDIIVRRENETPNATALALWAIYNSQIKEKVLPIQLQKLLNQAGLLGKAPVTCDFSELLPKPEDIEAIKEEAATDRQRINEVFRAFSQPEMETTPLAAKEMVVTQNHINAALLLMIKKQHDQITVLTKRVAELTASGDVEASQ